MKQQSLLVAVAAALALAGCGGGGGGRNATVLPAAAQASATPPALGATATASAALAPGAATIVLPQAGETGGSLLLNVADADANAHVAVTTSTAPPDRAAASLRASTYTARLHVDAPVRLAEAPTFTITAPAMSGAKPENVGVAVYDAADPSRRVTAAAHAAAITAEGARFVVDLGTTRLDASRDYLVVFTLAIAPFANVTHRAALFAVPSHDEILAIDLSPGGATRVLKGANTTLHAPVDVASGPNGEIVALNRQESNDPFGDVTSLSGSGAIFSPAASGDAAPATRFPASYARLDHLTHGPTGLVYAYGSGDAGHQSEIDLVAGTNPTFGQNRPDIAGYRRFLSVNYASTAADGQLAASVSDYGNFGGFSFSEYSLSIAGVADYLNLSSNVPGDVEVKRDLPLYDFQFSPDDGKLYLLTGDGENENCQTAPSKLRVYARGPFSLDLPERTLDFGASMRDVRKIRFDRDGALYAFGVNADGAIVVAVYASPALGGGGLTLLRTISVDAQIKAAPVSGFAVQVVPQ